MNKPKRLRILFVTNNYTPYSGGVVSSINAAIQELQQRGYKVFIITLDFLGKHCQDPYYVFRIPCPIKFTYKKNPMAIPFRVEHYIVTIIKKINPNIIHVHHPFLLGRVALRVAQKFSIPIVFTHHTMYDRYLYYIPLPQCITRWLVNSMVRNFCNAVDGVIVPSTAIKKILENRAVTKPIETIPSALLTVFVSKELFIKKHQVSKPFQLLMVSRFRKEKNIPLILDVFKKLKGDFSLTLAGYGQEDEHLQTYAYNTLQLPSDKVIFVRRPRKETLRDLYVDSDLFLFSSTTDTQGLVLAEAMASSTPVVAVDGPGQRDIIHQGINGFIVANKNEMKQKIEEIASNQKLHETLQMGAFKTAQRYKADQLIEKLLMFYRKIIHIS